MELDEWGLDEISLWPEIWGKESVGLLQALEESSAEILSGSGLSGTCGVDIIDTSELKDLLGNNKGEASWAGLFPDHSGLCDLTLHDKIARVDSLQL